VWNVSRDDTGEVFKKFASTKYELDTADSKCLW
jgi:hypothetical protein